MTSIDKPQSTPVPQIRFSPKLLEEFTQAVLEWTRKYHPERLVESKADEAN